MVRLPTVAGAGTLADGERYGVSSLDEAKTYLGHPVLGARLRECTRAVLDCPETSLAAIFGSPDDMKFQSSMTLFDVAAGDDELLFYAALQKYCGGRRDPRTLERLEP